MMTGAFSQNVGKLFSELKLVTDNLLSIYAAANWEATERFWLSIARQCVTPAIFKAVGNTYQGDKEQ